MQSRETTIINRLGLHARAAAEVVRLANRFSSSITLFGNGLQANAKTVMELLMLGAPQGTDIRVETEGPDESEALEAVVALIENRFNELE
ncbi:MAG: HPr family phosphocarrier protein [bacterium]|jgi:phosphocarrier protein HPr